jgi:hypothetical protein
MAGPVEPGGTVLETTMSPKLAPAGVFTEFVVPLKVKVVLPLIFVKTATFVPLILKTPVVLKVTGSALASAVPSATITANRAPISVILSGLPISIVPPLSDQSCALIRVNACSPGVCHSVSI